MKLEQACAFTGHRPYRLMLGKEGDNLAQSRLIEALMREIHALNFKGVRRFYTGMAQGVDLWCAEIVLELSKTAPFIELVAALPFSGQERRWSAEARERYRRLLNGCSRVVDCSLDHYKSIEGSLSAAYLNRNRYMVDNAQFLLAVYDPNGAHLRSGTGQTVRYAQNKRRSIICIHPDTLAVSNL